MPKQARLEGRKFGRLIVISQNGTEKNHEKLWLSQCECGNQITTRTSSLTKGITQSCGCLRRELAREKRTTHGMTKTAIYSVYRHMIKRCCNPSHRNYYLYGARGISVCDKWRGSFENFYQDMRDGYKPGLSIDRIDNNKGYGKENCRWASTKEQNNNTRQNICYFHKGKTYTISQLAEMYDIKYDVLRKRLRVAKWPLKKALNAPIGKRGANSAAKMV